MTSLRTFQNEIDKIQHREALKQKIMAHVASEKDAKEKDPAKRPAPTKVAEVKADVANKPSTEDVSTGGEDEPELAGVEAGIQVHNIHTYMVLLLMTTILVITIGGSDRRGTEPCGSPSNTKSWRVCVPNRCTAVT